MVVYTEPLGEGEREKERGRGRGRGRGRERERGREGGREREKERGRGRDGSTIPAQHPHCLLCNVYSGRKVYICMYIAVQLVPCALL